MVKPSSLNLKRYPNTQDPNLRAWSAADEYVLDTIANDSALTALAEKGLLIVNDQFGALNLCLGQFSPWTWSDSYLSQKALEINHKKNGKFLSQIKSLQYSREAEKFLSSNVDKEIPAEFSLVILRLPKHLSLLEYQLACLQPYLNKNTQIIACGMTKEVHKSTLKLFEKWIGNTKTSLAKKKARLIFSSFENKTEAETSPIITGKTFVLSNPLNPELNLQVVGSAGVFSRERLDIGSEFLLKSLPDLSRNSKIADLGCGSGVIGAAIAQANANVNMTMTDESYLAIESTNRTFSVNNLSKPRSIQTDVFDGLKRNQLDMVVCNPPFHQHNTQTLSIANKMFREASRCLKESGAFYVVANRHLKYGGQLKKYFEHVEIAASNKKFIIWHSYSPLRS